MNPKNDDTPLIKWDDMLDQLGGDAIGAFSDSLDQFDTDLIRTWYEDGCPHPAPPEVAEAKLYTALSWSDFAKALEAYFNGRDDEDEGEDFY